MDEAIGTALHRLGVYENTQGFYAAEAAVFVAMQEPESLRMVTKWLYPEAAKRYGGSREALEKSLRLAVVGIWKTIGRDCRRYLPYRCRKGRLLRSLWRCSHPNCAANPKNN